MLESIIVDPSTGVKRVVIDGQEMLASLASLTPAQQAEVAAATAPPVIVPHSVSRFQARAALHQAGLLEAVEAAMVDPATPMLARLAWQDAVEFNRNSPTVLAMAAGLGLTAQQLDALFVSAGEISA